MHCPTSADYITRLGRKACIRRIQMIPLKSMGTDFQGLDMVRERGIDILKKRDVRKSKQLYDKVWNALENELTYPRLAQLTLEHMSYLKK